MEVRDTVHSHSPPFWASPSNASNPSPSSPYSTSRSTQSGIKPLLIVLVFSIVVLLFLPSILSSPFKNPRSSLSIKSGWDMLNLCLVAFAILCGVLSRTGDGSGSGSGPESGSFKPVRSEWSGFANPIGEANRTTTIRRMRSTNSYPDLRVETDVWGQNRVPDGWRFFDDAELYRTRRPVQPYRVLGFGEEDRECKNIPVDTERLPLMEEQVEIEANFEEGKIESDTSFEEEKKGREAMEMRWQRRSLEALPRIEEVEKESMVAVGRRRRRSLERFPLVEEVERETSFEEVAGEMVQKRQMVVRRRRKSSEAYPKMEEMERETNVEEEMVEKPPEVVARRRTKSLEQFPEIEEVVKETNFGENVIEKPPLVVEVTPPPPPPPPPETKVAEECRKHKRSGSGGGAKDFASAIALLYQKKKKGNKSKRKEKQEASIEANVVNNISTTESNGNPSTVPVPVPPPPPPPPPASIFHQLFSNKKGGSKSRKIHSLSASAHSNSPSAVNIVAAPTPPPPPPNPRSHRSRKDQIEVSGYTRIEDSELYEQHRRRERSNLSPYAKYPLPPRSPLPPAPPPLPPVHEIVSEIREHEEQKSGGVAVFCASPDVNDKADLFIQRFKAGLKLEKINSIREKEIRKGRREREEEIGGEDDGRHV
ncbi:hydroxyproline-rich glycoprotein family protein [Rhynchospora pubera]|uniref:Hydroxyproline-rich glycoprotein family protein n=1 Tax=Rhynchospora pubera TaxID=906938 RepID=A0AAV8G248_9POAL|nr:hydroxyproline-rich glycoprotein family protein [Rhynchospora pubera]